MIDQKSGLKTPFDHSTRFAQKRLHLGEQGAQHAIRIPQEADQWRPGDEGDIADRGHDRDPGVRVLRFIGRGGHADREAEAGPDAPDRGTDEGQPRRSEDHQQATDQRQHDAQRFLGRHRFGVRLGGGRCKRIGCRLIIIYRCLYDLF